MGDWNRLEPDSSETQAGDVSIDYGVIGVRYSFDGFRQMIFANARLENSAAQDGLELGNVHTIGVRWDIPWTSAPLVHAEPGTRTDIAPLPVKRLR